MRRTVTGRLSEYEAGLWVTLGGPGARVAARVDESGRWSAVVPVPGRYRVMWPDGRADELAIDAGERPYKVNHGRYEK